MRKLALLGMALIVALGGCASSRMTDTARTGVEELLISTAADRAVNRFKLRPSLFGRKIYLGLSNFKCTDREYVVNRIRAKLGLREKGVRLVAYLQRF